MLKPVVIAAVVSVHPFIAGAAEVVTETFGEWRFESVSNTAPGGEQRVACSVATGAVSSPTVFISFASVDMMQEGTMSGFTYSERGVALGRLPIGSAAEIMFMAGGATAPGKVAISGPPDGENTLSEAYPADAEASMLLKAMQTSDALTLSRAGEALREVPLDGFADAYALAKQACHFDGASKG